MEGQGLTRSKVGGSQGEGGVKGKGLEAVHRQARQTDREREVYLPQFYLDDCHEQTERRRQ